MALYVGQVGIIAIPAALAVMATLEALILGTVLLFKIQRRSKGKISPQLTLSTFQP